MAKEKLNRIVDLLLEKYKGGEEYFDNLDAEIRKDENKDIIFELFKGLEDCHVVVSGRFGKHIEKMYNNGEIEVATLYVVNGGLRYGEIDDSQTKVYNKPTVLRSQLGICRKYFVFIDDSFYKGRTRNKINDYLGLFTSRIISTRVVYDGSVEKEWEVGSLFRYHK